MNLTGIVLGGILLPTEVLSSEWFAALAAFVAVNTIMYFALSVGKMLPRFYPSQWWYKKRHQDHRRATRSIYPDRSY